MTIVEVEKNIIADLEELGDMLMRTEFLLRCGKAYEGLDEEKKTEENLIKDCQVKTWIDLEKKEDRIFVSGDSESLIVKGAISLICEIFDDRALEETGNFTCSLTSNPVFTELFGSVQLAGLRSLVGRIQNF